MADTLGTTASSRVIINDQGQIAPEQSQYQTDQQSITLDKDWVTNAFMVADEAFSDQDDLKNRYYSTANMKFTDSRLGASIGINPRPQFCHFSDVPVHGRLQRNESSIYSFGGNYGMGRQFSEFVDDPAQRVYMSFGVPQFNSIFNFLTLAYEANQITLARTGRASSVLYNAGVLIGRAGLLTAFPLVSVAMFTSKVASFLSTRPKSKFYTFKQTMGLYWSAVNQLVQAMAINRGIIPKWLETDSKEDQIEGTAYHLDSGYLQALSRLMPEVFKPILGDSNKGIYFSVYDIATRAQRIANAILKEEYAETLNNQTDNNDYTNYVKKTMFQEGDGSRYGGHATQIADADGNIKLGASVDQAVSASNLLEKFFQLIGVEGSNSGYDVPAGTKDISGVGMEVDSRSKWTKAENDAFTPTDTVVSEGSGFAATVDALIRDGGLFATFIVDYTGPQSESWANSVGESELAQKLNGVVSSMSEARFSLMDGNIAGEIVGSAAEAVTDGITGVLAGITGGLSSAIQGLAGAGYIDIPKHWTGSNFNPTRASYSIKLISPYGNEISQMMNIDIPVAMLLAGALPRSTGKASYTAPFLCQIFDRGRCQMRLAMIENLSLSRGTSHLGFTDQGKTLAVDATFSVTDLSSIMHMPIGSGIFDQVDMTMDEDNILQDYLAVMAGMSVESQIYDLPRMRLKIAKLVMNAGQLTNSGAWATMFASGSVASVLGALTRRTAIVDPTGTNI